MKWRLSLKYREEVNGKAEPYGTVRRLSRGQLCRKEFLDHLSPFKTHSLFRPASSMLFCRLPAQEELVSTLD